MTTALKDMLWKCLPREERDKIIAIYDDIEDSPFPIDTGRRNTLVSIFGEHNLKNGDTTAKDEAFIVWRKDVQATYAYNEMILKHDPTHKGALLLKGYLLRTYGDKCLADEEKEQANQYDNQSCKPEPKFNIGDTVIVYVDMTTVLAKIADVHFNHPAYYYEIDHPSHKHRWFTEDAIQPFTEMQTLEESLPEAAKIINDNFDDLLMSETNPTVDNDGEPPIELYDLLKEHSGKTFYNPLLGSVTVTVDSDSRLIHIHQGNITVDIGPDGKDNDGNMALFPSKDNRNWAVFKKPNHTLHINLNPYENDKLLLNKAEEFEVAIDSLDEMETISGLFREALKVYHAQKNI